MTEGDHKATQKLGQETHDWNVNKENKCDTDSSTDKTIPNNGLNGDAATVNGNNEKQATPAGKDSVADKAAAVDIGNNGKPDEAAALLEEPADPPAHFQSWKLEEAVQNIMAEINSDFKDFTIPMKKMDILCNRLYVEIYNRFIEMGPEGAVDTVAILNQYRSQYRRVDDIKLITSTLSKIELQAARARVDGITMANTLIWKPLPSIIEDDAFEVAAFELPRSPLPTVVEIEEYENENEAAENDEKE